MPSDVPAANGEGWSCRYPCTDCRGLSSSCSCHAGFRLCVLPPCQQRSLFFFTILVKTTGVWWPPVQGSPFHSAYSLRIGAITFLHPARSFVQNFPCSFAFQVQQLPHSQLCEQGEAQGDMNLFSALLKLQHCPQIILTQRQCSSVHQPAHFALSKDTFPCME